MKHNIKIKLSLIILFSLMVSICALFAENSNFASSDYLKFSSLRESVLSQQTLAEQLGLSETEDCLYPDDEKCLLLANGSTQYQISPGDTFLVSYWDGKANVEYQLQVDEDCYLNIPSIGIAGGFYFTINQLKKQAKELIEGYYPFSYPQVSFIKSGLFEVKILGDMAKTNYFSAWGLSRISNVAKYVSPNANSRKVEITHRDGSKKIVDIFRIVRGEDEDVLLRPGDSIRFYRAQRIVTVSGGVRLPGTYQLTSEDSYDDLIEKYCGGYLPSADKNKILTQSYKDGKIISGQMDKMDMIKSAPNDGEIIIIPFSKSTDSIIYLEGALSLTSNLANSIVSQATKTIYSFFPGEKVSSLIGEISANFLPGSDLESSYILRNGQIIKVNIPKILSGDTTDDIILNNGDRLIIPFNQLFINVTGAVNNPGSYAYVPDRTASYYVNLAGGASDKADLGIKWKIKDKDGNNLSANDVLEPESEIYVEKDFFKTDFQTTVAIVGLASTLVSILATSISIITNLSK